MFEFVATLEKTRERAIYMKRQEAENEEGLRASFFFVFCNDAECSVSQRYIRIRILWREALLRRRRPNLCRQAPRRAMSYERSVFLACDVFRLRTSCTMY